MKKGFLQRILNYELKSIEDASVIRKFSVLFSLMSFFPFIVLSSLFLFLKLKGLLRLNLNLLFWSAILVGVFALIGFFGMRRSLINLSKISNGVKDVLKGDLPERINLKASGDNEVAQIVRAFNEVVQKLEVNIQELQTSKNLLQDVLAKVASGASSTENINSFLDLILETTVNALNAKSGLLLLSEEQKNELVVKSSFGLAAALYSRDQLIPMEQEVVGWVVKQNRPLLVPRLQKPSAPKPISNATAAFEPPLICTPLVFQNKVLGAISVSGKTRDDNFQEEELIILSNLASQIALAIENAKLNADAQQTYLETITALALAVEARDPYSRGHSDRVSKYSVLIAQELGLDEEMITKIKAAAQLHDVGKIGISDEILRKPSSLNDYERQIMRQHPIIGEGIIVPLRGFSHLRGPIRHHHEWLNGEGYPDHLVGEQISLEARILVVADSFDAITTDRPYRKAMDFATAKQELLKYKGERYDSKIVDAFIKRI
jgi:HD-GYP domain-containing protein (c-di-GMP phosphodiesterase class II)/HAMP domain-containing protein